MTPESIRTKTFRGSLRGADRREVENFLAEVAAHVGRLEESLRLQESEQARLAAELERYARLEQHMQTLIGLAETQARELRRETETEWKRLRGAADEERKRVLQQAREEADLLRREAEHKSKVFLANANNRLKRVQDQIDQLLARRTALATRLKSTLQAEIDFLGALMRDDASTRPETLEYSDVNVSRKGLDAAQLDSIVRRLREIEGSGS